MLRRSDGLVRLEQGRGGQDWVLARRFCACTLLDATSVPLARRKGFAAIAVQRWSPFADTRFHIEWVGSRAMVWAWSPAQILELRDGEIAATPRRVRPESLYRGATQADDALLVAMDEGVEGRVWRDHAMVACQWWSEAPDLEEWNALRRGAGLAAAVAVPSPEVWPLAAVPWTRQRAEAFNDLASRHRKTLQALAVGLVLAMVMVPFAASLRLLVKTALLERVIEKQTVSVGSVLQARESAERDLAVVDDLLKLRPPARQLRLLATVVAATPGTGWQLLEWRMPDSGSLEVVLRMANPDPSALVRGWEGSGVFSNVSVDIGRTGNEVAVKATIAGGAEASAAGATR